MTAPLTDDERVELEAMIDFVDPGFDDVVSEADVAGSGPTRDPNRLTLHVPAEHTSLSLGRPCHTEAFHIADPGITGRTDRHIHWQVTGEHGSKPTFVSLGDPAVDAAHDRWNGWPRSDPEGDTYPGSFGGYAMLTDGQAVQESLGDHYLYSKEGSVFIKAHGDVAELHGENHARVHGRKNVLIVADDDQGDWTWNNWHTKGSGHLRDVARQVSAGLTILSGFIGVGIALHGKTTKSVVGAPGWVPWGAKEQALQGLALAGAVKSTVSLALTTSLGEGVGNVTLDAFNQAFVRAGSAVHVSGGVSATMDALVSSTVSSPIGSVIQGGVYVSAVAGVQATLRSYYDTNVKADLGTVRVQGAAGAELSSQVGPVAVTGTADVQLNSLMGAAAVHGRVAASLVAGTGIGYGVVARQAMVQMGATVGPELFGKSPVADRHVTVDSAGVMVQSGPSTLRLTAGGTFAMHKSATLSLLASGAARLSGGKVLLG